MADTKERLDVLLLKRGFFNSRERARESILSGKIFVNNIPITKCGKKIDVDALIDFRGKTLPYVSRGGLKLEKALESFNISLEDKICIDIGASTGGFTDCMLQNGALKVYAIDVGKNQLHDKLLQDSRVVSLENTNARYMSIEDIGEYCDFASVDVSFISLTKIIPSVIKLLNADGDIVVLIKPQFEAGKAHINKKGVVKNKNVHKEVINNIISFTTDIGLSIKGLNYSPVKGPNGNIEYLLCLTKNKNFDSSFSIRNTDLIVDKAHEKL
ncbi:hemolysin A [Clostridium tepidiprofundi DSM 19306]|uniref:Hemolysin A n=1 Tax=Clostridium tepidiprofundi DSM 19306 TaxID=1121338 RepID=A0A151B6Y5_9CLOT|nr:TlyA family RNA methyltransferase [Clostridium tepidiprofundi]KYH35701.1 hemolysin A [Clostridium tepidiprofundi DSM 19306]